MDFSYLDDWMEDEEEELEPVGEGYRNVWVLAEARGDQVLKASLEATGQARELADQIGVSAFGLLVGTSGAELADALFAHGADRVLVASDPSLGQYQPERYTSLLARLVDEYRPEILLFSATELGSDLAPRLAQRLGTGLISHCVALELDMSERLLVGTFPVLGGEMTHTATCPKARPQMATLQPGYFRVPYPDSFRTGNAEAVPVDLDEVPGRLTWTGRASAPDLPRVPLSEAQIVVSAGRGLKDRQGFALAEQLAEVLGGVVAGTRGAFDEGWISEEQVVGAGGTTIAPDLYIACGLSGDIYHSFGHQDARYVVAINTDPNAPIMKAANIAVVGDAQKVIAALLQDLAA